MTEYRDKLFTLVEERDLSLEVWHWEGKWEVSTGHVPIVVADDLEDACRQALDKISDE